MNVRLDALRQKIAGAGDAGLAMSKMRLGKGAGDAKAREAELRDLLAELAREGAIRGPFKNGAAQVYFAAGAGPTVDKVSELIERLVREAGVKPPSKKGLEGKIKGVAKRYFADALQAATARRAILEIACGATRYYLHRDVAAERFGLDAAEPKPALSFAELAAAYRRLKAAQGGFTAVNISDVVKALGASTQDVHALIAAEAKAGRVALHPTNSVNLPREAAEAALRLPGHAEPFVTLAVREEP